MKHPADCYFIRSKDRMDFAAIFLIEGPWCWVLANVHRFAKPIPYRGAQGLFEVPDELVRHA